MADRRARRDHTGPGPRGEISDPARAQLALEAAAARICMPWIVDPETVTDDDLTPGARRIEQLVDTLMDPANHS